MNKSERFVREFVKKAKEKRMSPLKAIRARCLDCVCYQTNEVAKCGAIDCPLYPFRMGRNNTGVKTSKKALLAPNDADQSQLKLKTNNDYDDSTKRL